MNYVADSSDITESKSIPNNWETACLADFAIEFISGGTPSTKESDFWDGEIPWTTSAPISEQDVLLCKAQRFITQRGLKSSASNIVPKGNLIVGTRVGVGKAVTNTIDMAISQDLTGVVLNYEKVQPEYISYYFKTQAVQQFFNGRKRGTTIKGVSRSDLQSLVINLPPLPEQRAIARALRAVQAAREARLREIALERERKAALMEHLFTHGTRGEPTKMTEIGEMPEGWKTPKLADLAEIQSGGTPLRNHHEYYNGSINWAKTLDLNDGIVRSTEEKITDLGFQSIRGKIRPIDTVMVAMYGGSGTVGKSGILGIPAATNQAVCCIEPNFERFDSLYLLYYLIHFRPNWMRYAIGTRKDPNISKGIIESLKVPLPPLGQQKEISRTIKACDSKITALGKEACLLDELFRVMLEEFITGRLLAKDLILL